MTIYPPPKGGASLILSFRLQDRITLILGSGTLAASRAFSALEADSGVFVIARGGQSQACPELQWRADHDQLTILDSDDLLPSVADSAERETLAFETFLDTFNAPQAGPNPESTVSLVCITDTLLSTDPSHRRSHDSAERLYRICRSRNIPVNVTDMPDLCDFSFTSTHRFETPQSKTPLQIGVTTNGQGCRLAGRIRREIVARLPPEAGAAVQTVGRLREMVKNSTTTNGHSAVVVKDELPDDNEDTGLPTPNLPVSLRRDTDGNETAFDRDRRRMKWAAQISEYWPLSKLANMSTKEMEDVLNRDVESATLPSSSIPLPSIHTLSLSPPKGTGRILLVGSGPGHPALLTRATHSALTEHAQLVLSDKLVPAAVLALIPSHVEVRIARKFPGNADGAQHELMLAAVDAARKGLTVVRLKQGDPVVYGRAGEEVLFFRAHGFEPVVVPGVSSALAAPVAAGIPITQRGVAESFVVCTAVGREGKGVRLPGYIRSRTLVVLMGVARLKQVVGALLAYDDTSRDGLAYPACLPIALIERATMPDQRVIESTLADVMAALESVGEQRPPGLLVVGWAVLALWGEGDTRVLEDGEGSDEQRVRKWLSVGGPSMEGLDMERRAWRVREGLEYGWSDL